MTRRVALVLLSLAFGVTAVAGALECHWRCYWNKQCWSCPPGNSIQDYCHATCHTCMGSTCGGSLAGEKAVIQSLIMAPREQVAQAVGEAAASVLADLWQSYNSPLTDKYPSLDLAGGVVVKGEPTDFTLQVRQVPAGQEYELRVGERSLAITIQELSEEQAVLVFHGETPEAKQVAGELAFTPVRHDPETPESILLYHK